MITTIMSAIHSISNRDFDALGVEVDVGIVKTMQEDRIPLGLQSPKMLFKIGMDTENEKWGGRGRCVWREKSFMGLIVGTNMGS